MKSMSSMEQDLQLPPDATKTNGRSRARAVLAIVMTIGFLAASAQAGADDAGKGGRAKATPADANKKYHPGPEYEAKTVVPAGTTATSAQKKAPHAQAEILKPAAVNPTGGPGPRSLDGAAKALNPQPIPPGHVSIPPPRTGAPIEKTVH